jgi:hypothetical protein
MVEIDEKGQKRAKMDQILENQSREIGIPEASSQIRDRAGYPLRQPPTRISVMRHEARYLFVDEDDCKYNLTRREPACPYLSSAG